MEPAFGHLSHVNRSHAVTRAENKPLSCHGSGPKMGPAWDPQHVKHKLCPPVSLNVYAYSYMCGAQGRDKPRSWRASIDFSSKQLPSMCSVSALSPVLVAVVAVVPVRSVVSLTGNLSFHAARINSCISNIFMSLNFRTPCLLKNGLVCALYCAPSTYIRPFSVASPSS